MQHLFEIGSDCEYNRSTFPQVILDSKGSIIKLSSTAENGVAELTNVFKTLYIVEIVLTLCSEVT